MAVEFGGIEDVGYVGQAMVARGAIEVLDRPNTRYAFHGSVSLR